MNYKEITAIIEDKRRFEKESGREVMKKVLPLYSHPEKGMKIIHIAGTNGKGSVAAFLSSMLRSAGFHVGVFTSPHLVDFRERIRFDDEMISEEDVIRLGNALLSDQWPLKGTMFDYCLIMALTFFKEKKPDYVILEAGLGGRLDSTNGLSEVPIVSIITRIGLDHTEYLGDTIGKIAKEKAGILKKGTYLVLSPQEREAEEAIIRAADAKQVPYSRVSEQCVSVAKEILPDSYQRENAAVAATAFMHIFSDDKMTFVREGIKKMVWPGRLEIVSEDPFFMMDGAHNPNGVSALYHSLLSMYPGEKFIFLFGVMADKDYYSMLKQTFDIAEHYITVTVSYDRAESGEKLCRMLHEQGIRCEYEEDMERALEKALSMGRMTGRRVVAFGSLYFIGDLKRIVEKRFT